MAKLEAFKLKYKGRVLDYRIGQNQDLDAVANFFSPRYKIHSIENSHRHVIGTLQSNNQYFFLKLAKSEGIGVITEIEASWNKKFNTQYPRPSSFWVPQNIETGYFNDLFYLITEKFEGKLLTIPDEGKKLSRNILDKVIDLAEIIQSLEIDLRRQDKDTYINTKNYKKWFLLKAISWFQNIPENIKQEFRVEELLKVLKSGYRSLNKKPRHGDFTPWHIMRLKNGSLGLIDGEHAMSDGVEYYDICYFIQRVFCVLKDPQLSKTIYKKLIKRGYDAQKCQLVLASRAIGGFLDESLNPKPNYSYINDFKSWVLGI